MRLGRFDEAIALTGRTRERGIDFAIRRRGRAGAADAGRGWDAAGLGRRASPARSPSMSVDSAPGALPRRLRERSARGDLRAERRLWAKSVFSPEALGARLRQQAMLRRAHLRLVRLARAAELSGTSRPRDAS